MPPVDIYAGPEAYLLIADVPGAKPDDLSISLERGELTISATTDVPNQGTAVFAEFGPVEYRWAFRLPDDVDAAAVDAKLTQGVLSLKLPRRPETRSRRVPIRAA